MRPGGDRARRAGGRAGTHRAGDRGAAARLHPRASRRGPQARRVTVADDILLDVRDLRVSFGPVRAVDGVSLAISRGPFGIALVGESGSGKTTMGRASLRLVPAAGGEIRFDGQDVFGLRGPRLRAYRRAAQMVVQDADNSLDPRKRVQAANAHGR